MLNQLNFILQSQPTNKKFPFIDKCLKLKRNQKYGRYIVTKKSCKFGDIVGIEKPSCFIRFGVNTYFCSEVCRKKALETYHNKSESTDCCFKTRMAQIMMENAIKAFDGCRCKLKELFCDNKLYPKTIFDFELNNDDEIENQKSHLLAMFSLIEGVNFGDKNIDEVDHYFVDCALAIAKKCCHLTSAQNIRGIFLLGSLFNHSCAPNVMVFQFGQVNVYTVIRPIIEGEQLFISYGPSYLNQKKIDRQTELLKYDFICDCEACKWNYLTRDELEKANRHLTPIQLPSWPDSDPASTLNLAIQRYDQYSTLLQQFPELLLNNLDGVLITEYISTCLKRILDYEQEKLNESIKP